MAAPFWKLPYILGGFRVKLLWLFLTPVENCALAVALRLFLMLIYIKPEPLNKNRKRNRTKVPTEVLFNSGSKIDIAELIPKTKRFCAWIQIRIWPNRSGLNLTVPNPTAEKCPEIADSSVAPPFPAQVLEEGGQARLTGRLPATRPSGQHQLHIYTVSGKHVTISCHRPF